MRQVLPLELEALALKELGLDRGALFDIYLDYRLSDFHFERHFVKEESVELDLMLQIRDGFAEYDKFSG